MSLNEALKLLIDALVAVAVAGIPIVIKFVVVWLKAKAAEAEKYIKPDVLAELKFVASWAVKAVEQLAASGLIDYDGRKRAAIDMAEKFLAERGIVVDLDLIADAIEAAVLENGFSSKTRPAYLNEPDE